MSKEKSDDGMFWEQVTYHIKLPRYLVSVSPAMKPNNVNHVYSHMKNTFAQDVHDAMVKQNLTKEDLAKKLGRSKQYVTRILNGTLEYHVSDMSKIACALDMDIGIRMHFPNEKVSFEKIENYKK